jgi:hypothetical protein
MERGEPGARKEASDDAHERELSLSPELENFSASSIFSHRESRAEY